MSGRIGTPVNQKRLTNVSIVKLMKAGKRFEIACYCNKVESWRKGIEKDLSEVLQSEFVFTNVSKGEFANSKDLKKAFGTDDILHVQTIILTDGELQLTAKERQAHKESTFRDIATIISEKCINPTNSRPYTVSTILSALRDDLKYGLIPGRSAKQQALDLIKKLQKVIPIVRARMHVRIHDTVDNQTTCNPQTSSPESKSSELSVVLKQKFGAELYQTSVETIGVSESSGVDYLIEPEVFKDFSQFIKEKNGRVEVVQLSVGCDSTDKINDIDGPSQSIISLNKDDKGAAAESVVNEMKKQQPLSINNDKDDDDNQPLLESNNTKSKRKSKATKRREKEDAKIKQDNLILKQNKAKAKLKEDSQLDPTTSNVDSLPPPPPTLQHSTSSASTSTSEDSSVLKSCTTCGGSFKTSVEYRAHFKSDWHRYNLKLKMAGQPVVSEEEFAVDAQDFF
mmetsp:Transcript_10366/g.12576  ORF Transcript_10366/g.12576 Transcript_10366/m.12576 type:complete len:453 (+) Transcript_10366:41-1399(+)